MKRPIAQPLPPSTNPHPIRHLPNCQPLTLTQSSPFPPHRLLPHLQPNTSTKQYPGPTIIVTRPPDPHVRWHNKIRPCFRVEPKLNCAHWAHETILLGQGIGNCGVRIPGEWKFSEWVACCTAWMWCVWIGHVCVAWAFEMGDDASWLGWVALGVRASWG
jgi:hypothetical protein